MVRQQLWDPSGRCVDRLGRRGRRQGGRRCVRDGVGGDRPQRVGTSKAGHANGRVCSRSRPAGTGGACCGSKFASVAVFTNPWAGEPIAVTVGGASAGAADGLMGQR